MARRKNEDERVLGPYPHRGGWRIYLVSREGERTSQTFATEKEAQRAVRALRAELGDAAEKTIDEAMAEYEVYLRHDKGNKPSSVWQTMHRVRRFFPDHDLALPAVDPPRAAGYYDALRAAVKPNGKPLSVDFHRNVLAEARTFLSWCVTKRRWLDRNPLDGVEGVGRRRHGKAQLRIDEARRFLAVAEAYAGRGEAGAVAAMVALLMGLRASEIVSREVRDLDDGGRLLWIPAAKTEAGKRTLQVPKVLMRHLSRLAAGKQPTDLLFGRHWRDWPRQWVQRICREAGLPIVTAHGMRGLHSTLAVDAGLTAHAVAAALGHESFSTTARSYAKPEAVTRARQARVLRVLDGGALEWETK